MDIFKATINLKEGTVQLEGSQEFVEKYLDQYKQLITSLQTAPKTSKTADTAEKENREQGRAQHAHKKCRNFSMKDILNSLKHVQMFRVKY